MFISSSQFPQHLEGMNGAGGNLIKNLLRVALRNNHTVKSFWFWSTSNTLKSWQFSPAQARFHRCAVLLPRAGTFFLLGSPGESCATRQRGLALRLSRRLQTLQSPSEHQCPGWAGTMPLTRLLGWRGTAWTQLWARGKC